MSTSLAIDVEQTIEIHAAPEQVFEGLLAQMGPENERPDGVSMQMKLEAFPGGRWFRDLGNSAGHLWAHVQVIKPPVLLELCGPLFMSYPAMNFVQYRLEEAEGGTRLTLRHQAMGSVASEHIEGVQMGWQHLLEGVKRRSE